MRFDPNIFLWLHFSGEGRKKRVCKLARTFLQKLAVVQANLLDVWQNTSMNNLLEVNTGCLSNFVSPHSSALRILIFTQHANHPNPDERGQSKNEIQTQGIKKQQKAPKRVCQ